MLMQDVYIRSNLFKILRRGDRSGTLEKHPSAVPWSLHPRTVGVLAHEEHGSRRAQCAHGLVKGHSSRRCTGRFRLPVTQKANIVAQPVVRPQPVRCPVSILKKQQNIELYFSLCLDLPKLLQMRLLDSANQLAHLAE